MLIPSLYGESLFDDFFDGFTHPAKSAEKYSVPMNAVMRTDVKESETGYELDIELPGYSRENVQAQLKDGYLNITASNKTTNDQKNEAGQYIRRERYYGTCSRSFYVGKDIEQQDIKAKFEDGILRVYVPKKDAKPEVEENKYITIEG